MSSPLSRLALNGVRHASGGAIAGDSCNQFAGKEFAELGVLVTSEEATQDIADKAVSSYTREFLYSLSDNDRNTLLQIDQAIGRVEDGTYGNCLNCGTLMSEKRLNAVPWAPHCVDCQFRASTV